MSDEPEVMVSPRPLCPATWGRTKGYIEVRDPGDGSVHEIPYHQATDIWKADIRALRSGKR